MIFFIILFFKLKPSIWLKYCIFINFLFLHTLKHFIWHLKKKRKEFVTGYAAENETNNNLNCANEKNFP